MEQLIAKVTSPSGMEVPYAGGTLHYPAGFYLFGSLAREAISTGKADQVSRKSLGGAPENKAV